MDKNRELEISRGLAIFILKSLVFSSLLFLSAGSMDYLNGWIFIASFYLPDFLILIHLAITDTELLQKRLTDQEKEKPQKFFNLIFRTTAIIVLILSGLDYRFHWSDMPIWLVLASAIITIFGFIVSFVVMKQNSYASRIIEIQEGQKIINTGLYSVIRHPMYLSAILIFCSTPLVLGSFYAFALCTIIIPFLFAIRIMNEEKVLRQNLIGYTKYAEKVKYRLIPFIW